MLEGIRKRRNSMIILLAFAAIIIVFIFWGVGPNGGDNAGTVVATVNGEDISVREYANLYKREVQYFKENLKDQFTDDVAEKMNLKQRALDILINRALAEEAARDEGIKVAKDEVQEAIRSIPQFSSNGSFNKDLYFQVLSSNRVKPADFEKSIEADILTSKVREKVIKDVAVSDDEVRQTYLRDNRKLNLGYIVLDGARFVDEAKVTDEEAREFLRNNGSIFMEPARIKTYYAYADFAAALSRVKFTAEELKDYYDRNPKEFEVPAAIKARHILIRPDKAADKDKAKIDAKKKIDDVLKKLKAGANFAALAKEASQDPGSAKQGGDLGWFQKGVMVKSFDEAAFALKKGEVSSPVETEFGYHVILVEDMKEAGKVSLKEAEPVIKRSLLQYKVKNTAKENLMPLDKPFKEAKTLEELKKAASLQKNVKVTETPFFTAEDSVELARNEMLRDVVFSMKTGESSGFIETPQGIYLIRVVEKQEARVPSFEAVASKVKRKLAEKKAGEEASKKAEEALKRAKAGEDLAAIAKAEKLKAEESGFFSRVEGFMPRTGIYVVDKDDLFSLDKSGSVYGQVVRHNGKFYVLKLNDTKEADTTGLEPRKEVIRQRLIAEKQEKAIEGWIKGLREKAKIKVYEELM